MRKEVLKRFAAGTCSVCMLYALGYSAVEVLANEAPADAPAIVAYATPAATASPAQDSASAPAYEFPADDGGSSGRRGRGGRGARRSDEAIIPDESASGAQMTDSSSQTNQTNGTQTVTSGDDAAGSSPPTLNQYLSALRCGGCRRNCLLVSPRCMNGRSKAEAATVEYYQLYPDP